MDRRRSGEAGLTFCGYGDKHVRVQLGGYLIIDFRTDRQQTIKLCANQVGAETLEHHQDNVGRALPSRRKYRSLLVARCIIREIAGDAVLVDAIARKIRRVGRHISIEQIGVTRVTDQTVPITIDVGHQVDRCRHHLT